MNRVESQSNEPSATAARPRWRTPELRSESVASLTGIDPVSTLPTDGSIYPNLGNNS